MLTSLCYSVEWEFCFTFQCWINIEELFLVTSRILWLTNEKVGKYSLISMAWIQTDNWFSHYTTVIKSAIILIILLYNQMGHSHSQLPRVDTNQDTSWCSVVGFKEYQFSGMPFYKTPGKSLLEVILTCPQNFLQTWIIGSVYCIMGRLIYQISY